MIYYVQSKLESTLVSVDSAHNHTGIAGKRLFYYYLTYAQYHGSDSIKNIYRKYYKF
jgi:hypothetical protein